MVAQLLGLKCYSVAVETAAKKISPNFLSNISLNAKPKRIDQLKSSSAFACHCPLWIGASDCVPAAPPSLLLPDVTQCS